MSTVSITTAPKKFPFLPRQITFSGTDEAIEMLLTELKIWGPFNGKIKSTLNFEQIDAILQQIQVEK